MLELTLTALTVFITKTKLFSGQNIRQNEVPVVLV